MHFFMRVITSPFTVRRIILLHIVPILLARASITKEEQKCTENDPRHPYNDCMIDKHTVWCDKTSFKRIPPANTINSFFKNKTDCREATFVFINDSCISEIEKDDLKEFQRVQVITFKDNLIIELKDEVFQNNKHLVSLDVCKNRIGRISTSAFHGLRNLTHLNLARNQLKELESQTFQELNHLQDLTLDNNFLSRLIADGFNGLRNLKVLRIRGNRIAYIDVHAFKGMPKLTHLHLDGNELESLDPKVFQHFNELEVLTLSHNKLRVWPLLGSFLPNLHTLDLGHNIISEFNTTHVMKSSKLQNLSLVNNSIVHIDEELFKSTPRLGHLNLGQNHIEEIPKETFSHLCYLKSLILTGNRLKTPHMEWFIIMANFSQSDMEIKLEGNIWDCQCNAVKYWAYINGLQSVCEKGSCVLDIYCHSPAKFENRSLKSLNKSELAQGDCHEISEESEPGEVSRPKCTPSSFKVKPMPQAYVMPVPPIANDPEVQAVLKSTSTRTIILICVVVVLLLVVITLGVVLWGKKRGKKVSGKKRLPTSNDEMLESKPLA